MKERLAMRPIRDLLVTVALMMVAMVALSGVASAQGGDVCVSNKGENKVQKGDSTCSSDSTSHAVATNDSFAIAANDSSANAHNDSTANAVDDSSANATNDSSAVAFDNCTATAHNGEADVCP
jgi:hypothetical protein